TYLFVITFQANAHAGSIAFDPSSCRSGMQGQIYIALGRVVFRLPQVEVNLEVISELPKGDQRAKLPMPPDPGEPLGCSGNPLQLFGFQFYNKYKDRSKFLYEKLRLTALPFDLPNGVASENDWFEYNCTSTEAQERLAEGLDACYWSQSDSSMPIFSRAVRYKSPLEIYATPKGLPFVIDCYPANAETAAQKCYVRYKLFDSISVYYVVDAIDVPIGRIMEFDRKLRARIEAAHVPDYNWLVEER
ncbi:MAG: hypothetical protein MJA83_05055, partial [Gammaproteobacteria bacterium]|nr:hypothetical protein [Gammaproteobacteria bacterium]